MPQNAQQYFDQYQGQSLLFAPSPAREKAGLRGECVQGVCFYVTNNGKPVIWDNAYPWFSRRLFQDQYEYIPYEPGFTPQPNDIIVWLPTLPGSGGDGHIAVYLRGNSSSFVSVDQNWGGRTIHQVSHNYSYVAGVIRFRGGMGGGSAPVATPQGGDEMIANTDQAHKAYQLLRINGDGSPDEIDATAGRRTWAGFANDAQPEVAARNAAEREKDNQLAVMQNTINNQNQTITDLTSRLTDASTTAQEKQAALTQALQKIASDNADMATAHDTIVDLDDQVKNYQNNPVVKAQAAAAKLTQKPSSISKLIAAFMAAFSKFKKQK